jgi:hypothetical protein
MSGLLSNSGDRSAVGINMRVLLAVAAILAIGVSAAAAGDPVGRYTSYWIDSKTGRGQSTVVVRQIGSTYRIEWGDGGGDGTGFGILNGDLIAVIVTQGDSFHGLSLFGEENDGWEGPFANISGNDFGAERWAITDDGSLPASPIRSSADLAGRYVMSGSNPDGSTYSGHVTVKRAGNTLQIVSVVNNDQRIGVGIGYRDGLAVTFDDKAGKLLQVFKIDGDGLIGFWANDGDEQMGSERWARWTQ